MIFPALAGLTDVSLLLLRVLIAAVFGTSGWSHMLMPAERGESIELTPSATFALGLAEVAAAVMMALGLFTQVAALVFIVVMLGALYKKVFVWRTGFWGEESLGWYYELLYLVCTLVLLATDGGAYTLT